MTGNVFRICVDKDILGHSPYALARFGSSEPAAFPIAVITGRWWKSGQVLNIRFLNGDVLVQKKVQEIADELVRYANLKFKFHYDEKHSEIRIGFGWNGDKGSWSYIGKDALDIPQNEPTINFGWLAPETPAEEYSKTVLHIFGHAIGLIHEYQNPAADIPWDKDAVYKYFMGPPYNWSRQEVERKIFERYSRTITNKYEFDPESVMLFPIPGEYTLNHREIGGRNSKLSKEDKRLLRILYP